MRALDERRSYYVLRADKLLTASSISAKNRLAVLAENRSDIGKTLQRYGVDLVVVESSDRSGIPIHEELRVFLEEGPFRLLKSIPVEQANRPPLKGQRILVYRYENMSVPSAKTLKLPVPVVGKTIEVPWSLTRGGELNME